MTHILVDKSESTYLNGSAVVSVMTQLSDVARSTYRRHGARAVLRKSVRFAVLRGRRWAYNRAGGYPLSVDGYAARFPLSSVWELVALEYINEEERAVIQHLLDELEAGDVYWDVGAHIGVHACLCGQKAASVVAVEPYPPNAERLRNNLTNNGVDHTVVDAALSNENGERSMAVPQQPTPGNQWVALTPDANRTADVMTVAARTGDSVRETDDLPPPNVVKVDVEGAAHEVLSGLAGTLRREDCHTVVVEVHLETEAENSRPAVSDFGHDPSDVQSLLESYGFDVETLLRRESDYFLTGHKPRPPDE